MFEYNRELLLKTSLKTLPCGTNQRIPSFKTGYLKTLLLAYGSSISLITQFCIFPYSTDTQTGEAVFRPAFLYIALSGAIRFTGVIKIERGEIVSELQTVFFRCCY